jgi:predicted CoA-binding protein
VRASLTELGVPVDVVDVFRRSDALRGHLTELLGMNPLPKVVWFQQGIRDDAVASELSAHGIDVIQDRCMLADHRRMGLGRIG